MMFHYSTYRLLLRHTFTIARSSDDYYDVVFIYCTLNGHTGIGEAAPSDRYGESFEQVIGLAGKMRLEDLGEGETLDEWLDKALPRCGGCHALEAAVDIALHDLWGKLHKTPVTRMAGSDERPPIVTSFTIAIDAPEKMAQFVQEAEPYSVLKIKLGSGHDKETIEAVRKFTDKPIRVDANEAWSLEEAKRMCDWLSVRNVQFVEQPLPASVLEETAKLKESSPLPLFADENCLASGDIAALPEAFHGINIKLMKCGGLREAEKMIALARKHSLKIMLGCMVESSVAITAAAALSPLVDYADLDGNLLITNDPFAGVEVVNGALITPTGFGLGTHFRKEER